MGVPRRRRRPRRGPGRWGAPCGGRYASSRRRPGSRSAIPSSSSPFSRWITPAEVKIRFDTWFFLAPLPAGAEAHVDGSEVVDARWYTPTAALAARTSGELFLVFPTIKHLEQLSVFASADALLAHAHGRDVLPVEPRVVGQGETARIVLPGEPGYSD